MTQTKPLNLVTIIDSSGRHRRAVAFGLADGRTYWLSRKDAEIAATWSETDEGRDMTRSAFVQKQAVKVDDHELALPKDLEPRKSDPLRHPFKIGDIVQLKSGGHPMTVKRLLCSEGTCADPYAGSLEAVLVIWSSQSQMDGFDLCEEEIDPRLIEFAWTPRPEGMPF